MQSCYNKLQMKRVEVGGLGFLIPDINTLIFRLPAIVLALTIHEYAHGRIAYAFGDPTAKNAGRLTFNPLRHLDVIGTLAMIYFQFGWAKPVPINPYYFQGNRGQKIMWVSLAGPLSNLAQALIISILLSLLQHFVHLGYSFFFNWLLNFLYYCMVINIVLAVFNLLPIPPLDGSKILAGLLSERHMNIVFALERYGFIILIAMMYFGILSKIINPIVNLALAGLSRLTGL